MCVCCIYDQECECVKNVCVCVWGGGGGGQKRECVCVNTTCNLCLNLCNFVML